MFEALKISFRMHMRRYTRIFPGRLMLPVAAAFLALPASTARCQMEGTAPMKITSTQFIEGGEMPARFTADGENVSPDLQFADVPATAKSLVLIVQDPDAPRGTLTHWLVWNLKPDLKEILANSPPQDAVQGVNFLGRNDYTGPNPPSGTHHYHFLLYALDATLKLPPKSDHKAVEKAMEGHVLAKAELIGLYTRGPK